MPEGPRDRLGNPIDEQPDGPLSGTLYRYHLEVHAAGTHALAEGHEVGVRTILKSYDRAEHPWLHGRRPHDLAERLWRGWPW